MSGQKMRLRGLGIESHGKADIFTYLLISSWSLSTFLHWYYMPKEYKSQVP